MARPELFQSAYTGFSDTSGNPLSGGKVYSYDAGTTTPRTTWQNPSKTLTHANPVVLDSNGRAEIWAEGNYKFEVRTATEVIIDTIDNVYLNRDDLTGLHAGTSTGAAGAYAITIAPPLLAYSAGQVVSFVANHTNTGNSTININGLGARTLVIQGLTQIFPGAIQAGGLYYVAINGTNAVLLNPNQSIQNYTPTVTYQGGGTATATSTSAAYDFVGAYVIVTLLHIFTVNSGTVNAVRFTLPVTPVSLESSGGAFVSDGALLGGCFYGSTTTTIEIRRYDGAAFGVSSNRQVGAQFRYRWI
jgi:hypothetical protein